MTAGRILITGGTGFVGRHLVPRLLRNRLPLTLALRSRATCPASWHGHELIRIIETGPIETAANLEEALSGASTVVHMAGLAHVDRPSPEGGPDPFESANAQSTERLAAAASGTEVKTFIHLSSLFAVTDNASDTVVDDRTDRMPSTAYGRSKRMAEQYVMALGSTGVLGVSLRPTLIIGADAKGNWAVLQRVASTGLPLPLSSVRNRRSVVSVDTVANAIIRLCSDHWSPDRTGNYCLADEGALSLAEMVGELRNGMGLPARLFPFPPELIQGIARIAGQQRRVGGMLGNLEVDAGRFYRDFTFDKVPRAVDSIRESGRRYMAGRSADSSASMA